MLVRFGQLFFLCYEKNWIWKAIVLRLIPDHPHHAICNGYRSFHDFCQKSIVLWFFKVKSRSVCISLFVVVTCKSLHPSYTDPIEKMCQHSYLTWLLSHFAFIMMIKCIFVFLYKQRVWLFVETGKQHFHFYIQETFTLGSMMKINCFRL